MRLTRDELLTAVLNDPNATPRERELLGFLSDAEDDEALAKEDFSKEDFSELGQQVDELEEALEKCEEEVKRLEGIVAEYESSMSKAQEQDKKHTGPAK